MMFFNKKTQQTLCCDEKCFWIEYWFVFWEERFISELLLAKQFFESHILLIYFLLKSFIRIYIETWNLSFCFQHYLFVLKLVIDRAILQYLEFVFFFFGFMNLTLYFLRIAISTLKVLYTNFFWARFIMICLLYKFFIR